MIAIITYRFLGRQSRVHVDTREEFDTVLADVKALGSAARDVRVYECVEMEVP